MMTMTTTMKGMYCGDVVDEDSETENFIVNIVVDVSFVAVAAVDNM